MQKIIPCLWFEDKCEEAINFYIDTFNGVLGKDDSRVVQIQRYPSDIPNPPWGPGMEGKVITAIYELAGQRFMALDGGPLFKFNPTMSFMVNCETPEEVDAFWAKLSEGGSVMMPLQEYPFSKKYGWTSDKYGVSWQISVGTAKEKITPAFMFVGKNFGKCEEAINFYASVIKNSKVDEIHRYEPGEAAEADTGKVKYSSFTLEGQRFAAMENSFEHKFDTSGAISLVIDCETQEEIDHLWENLTQGGDPKAQQCGWLADKYGFAWQITPRVLGEMLSDPDKEKSNRAMQAMLEMKKLDIAGLEKAYNGN
jgi:predicted 3-demethylubiquinone-9 3-methyltransferase (glyoxalase superfamily)